MLKVLGSRNESQARWYVAREVLARGRGGLKARHEMSGLVRLGFGDWVTGELGSACAWVRLRKGWTFV